MEKILAGGLKSYSKENCLIDQIYIHDTSKSVSQAVKRPPRRRFRSDFVVGPAR